jgi:acetyl-CoA/propionyl-CoA carboxylase biotin carboxyl carrier protein
VNTRLQVEHTVTEETTGIDLVVEQLRIADGLPLSFDETPAPRGHALEFRINAEDVGRGFLPSPGRILAFDAPSGPGVRLDAGVSSGSTVPVNFDSMLGKLVITGAPRSQAIVRARRAVPAFRIDGVASVLPAHRAVMETADFTSEASFKVHTRWIETDFANTLAASIGNRAPETDPPLLRTAVEIDGRRITLGLSADLLRAASGESAAKLTAPTSAPAPLDPGAIKAPITGKLQSWNVADGDVVAAGDVVATMEAMKMEMRVPSPLSGRITLKIAAGASVKVTDNIAIVR